MKVFIDKKVHGCIENFYDAALLNHEALDEVTVIKKFIGFMMHWKDWGFMLLSILWLVLKKSG